MTAPSATTSSRSACGRRSRTSCSSSAARSGAAACATAVTYHWISAHLEIAYVAPFTVPATKIMECNNAVANLNVANTRTYLYNLAAGFMSASLQLVTWQSPGYVFSFAT